MTQLLDNAPDAPVTTPTPNSQGRKIWRWLAAFAVVGAVLGFAGGVTSHAIFPAKAGAQGPAGEAGPSGPAGPAGTSTDLGNVGYCFNYTTFDNQTTNESYVNSVSLTAPVNTNGTLSCPNGTFVPLQPTTSPNP